VRVQIVGLYQEEKYLPQIYSALISEICGKHY